MSIDDIETDYWAHYYAERPDTTEEFEDEDFDLEKVISEIDNDAWDDVTNEVLDG